MPLSASEKVVETSKELVETLKGAFHTPPGFRPAHAKGILLHGVFTPSTLAATLSTAPHFNSPSTPIIARFSSSTGIPQIPDTDPNGNPRGLAVRFVLGERKHTDIIAHSTSFFPVNSGQGFLDFLHAIGGGTIGQFLAENPAAAAFVQAPKPTPAGLEREKYFGINAFKLIDRNGKTTFVRYQIVPEAAEEFLNDEALAKKDQQFLYQGIQDTVKQGPVLFKFMAQVAEEGDVTNDATVYWPSSRKVIELGTIKLDRVDEDSLADQKKIIFDPIPRVEGIEPSDDPLLDMRATLYLISGRERRAA